MHIERIHFEEVFDIQAVRGDFSFRSRGRPSYGVNLHGGVIPQQGSTFAVAFEKPGDWGTVLGCRDLAAAKVGLRQPTWTALLSGGADFLLSAPLLIGAALVMGGSWPGMIMAALFILAVVYGVVQGVRTNRAVTRALVAVGERDASRDNLGAARPGTAQ